MNGDPTKLLVFGSLKGGVGKTTLSMLAVEALIAERRSVVLIDADTVGTEASEVLGKDSPYLRSSISLIDIFHRVPDHESVRLWLERELQAALALPDPKRASARRVLLPTFGEKMPERERSPWREVLERSGLYVQQRFRDLVSVCRSAGFDVVVDLPAFDVGLANEARKALAEQGTMFFVTDIDVRSINATLTYFRLLDEDPRPAAPPKIRPGPDPVPSP
jgi:hypothetical protein